MLFAAAIFFAAFIGSLAGCAALHRWIPKLGASETPQSVQVEHHAQSALCPSCKSHVHRYERWPDEHVVCANCVKERQQ